MGFIDLAVTLSRKGTARDRLNQILSDSRGNVPGNAGRLGSVGGSRSGAANVPFEDAFPESSLGPKYQLGTIKDEPAAFRRLPRDLRWIIYGAAQSTYPGSGSTGGSYFFCSPGGETPVFDDLPNQPSGGGLLESWLDPEYRPRATLSDSMMILPVGNNTVIAVVSRAFHTYTESECYNFEGYESPLPYSFNAESFYCAWVVGPSGCRRISVPEAFISATTRELVSRTETPLPLYSGCTIAETQYAWGAWTLAVDGVRTHAFTDSATETLGGEGLYSYPNALPWHTPLIYTAILDDSAYLRSPGAPLFGDIQYAIRESPYVVGTQQGEDFDLWEGALQSRYGAGIQFIPFDRYYHPQHWLKDLAIGANHVVVPTNNALAKTIAWTLQESGSPSLSSAYNSRPVPAIPDHYIGYDVDASSGPYPSFDETSVAKGYFYEIPRTYLWDEALEANNTNVADYGLNAYGGAWRVPVDSVSNLDWGAISAVDGGRWRVSLVPFEDWGNGIKCRDSALALGFAPEDLIA